MGRLLGRVYGTLSYVMFLGTFLYAIGFVGNWGVPKSIDSGETGPLMTALLVNFGLLCIFALQHNVMARTWFKARWTKIVPRQIERSTFVLFTNCLLILMFWQWRPATGIIWQVENSLLSTVLLAVSFIGWGVVLWSTYLIDHFDLFGMRQVVMWSNYTTPTFYERSMYRQTRHPLYLGFMIAFWATPVMTEGHLFFSLVTTAFMLWSIQFEEHDLSKAHPEYKAYKSRVPMLLPLGRKKA
jgi:protein-S-isoprenylcysteine O-methyltransferase Ste14